MPRQAVADSPLKPPLVAAPALPITTSSSTEGTVERKVTLIEDEKDTNMALYDSTNEKPVAPKRSFRGFGRRKGGAGAAPPGRPVKPPGPKPVPFRKLFCFATRTEASLNLLGILLAICAGAATPLMTIMFGNMANAITQFGILKKRIAAGGNDFGFQDAKAHLIHEAGKQSLSLMGIGLGMFVCTYTYMLIWTYTSEQQSKRLREKYLSAVLRQEIAYFDDLGPGALATHIQTDAHLVQVAISEKVPLIVQSASTFVTGLAVGFARNARLAASVVCILPLIILTGGTMGKHMGKAMMVALGLVAKAGAQAGEVFSSVRTVYAFEMQGVLGRRFNGLIEKSTKAGSKIAYIQGTGVGILFFISYAAYSIVFVYGGRLVSEGKTTVGIVINVVMAVLMGAFSVGGIVPQQQHLIKGCAAAAKLMETIERVPTIDSSSKNGKRLESVTGAIAMHDVHFHYPSRPDVPVLRGLTAEFEAGKTTALVGPSGGGKSTVISLIERFYDPLAGRITLDGEDLRGLNLRGLRGHIALVSQEPVLFATTIRENVEFGLIGTPHEHDSPENKLALVKSACEAANATEFINRLPQQYETLVGEHGARLSGGQKQRVAIARAIVSNPHILLLDEATSALDAHAERVVQEALDRAAVGRTTIVVAHRLATIRDAHKIMVISEGIVSEQGSHSELLALGGKYASLIEHQHLQTEKVDIGTKGAAADTSRASLDGDADDGKVVSAQGDSDAAGKTIAADVEQEFGFWGMCRRVLSFNSNMWRWYIYGLCGAITNGMVFPIYAILLGMTISDFERPISDIRGALERRALWFFIVALGAGFTVFSEIFGFTRSGWELSRKLRSRSFAAVLSRDIGWFDMDSNASGLLVSRITDGPEKIQGLFGVTLGAGLKSFTTLIGGCIIGLAYAPLLALVGIACVPLIFTNGYIRLRVVTMAAMRTQQIHSASTQMATEAAGSVRTVAALTREEDVASRYSKTLETTAATAQKSSIRGNALYAGSQSMAFFCIALVFYVGARFVADGRYDTHKFFTAMTAVVMGAVNSGQVFDFVPDASKALSAAKTVFGLIDNACPAGNTGSKPGNVQGHLAFDSVTFSYPTQSQTPILRGLSLNVPAGSYVALVGPSGCGKSTALQLLERFYNTDEGQVTLDGQDIRQLNLPAYRSHMALVSQEPQLYSGTIRFNVALGAARPFESVTDDEIMAACRAANIADFVSSLPEGLDTDLGASGTQLSGGQRQRVAIARALLRNPRILLLDEATAALDSESERVVQAALDSAATGRTVVAVAHRLSTVRHADMIYVFGEGHIVESGTHDQLIAKGGAYFELVQMQNVGRQEH